MVEQAFAQVVYDPHRHPGHDVDAVIRAHPLDDHHPQEGQQGITQDESIPGAQALVDGVAHQVGPGHRSSGRAQHQKGGQDQPGGVGPDEANQPAGIL